MLKIEYFNTVESTNDSVRACQPGTLLWADCQTKGRGQRGNSWESAQGENLTFSILTVPEHIRLDKAFILSQVTSLAVVETLARYGITAEIKWPNDVYVGDFKICGMLIENDVRANGFLNASIIGVGVNVNQEKFVSDAPNPISMAGLTGEKYSRQEVLEAFCQCFESLYARTFDEEGCAYIDKKYMSHLYRRDGFYQYRDPDGVFMARIDRIAPDGMITLCRENGKRSEYYFKEVEFCVKPVK